MSPILVSITVATLPTPKMDSALLHATTEAMLILSKMNVPLPAQVVFTETRLPTNA